MASKYIVVSNDKRIPHTLVFETNVVKYDVNKFICLAINGELEIDETGELWFDMTYLTENIYEALKSCKGITLRFYHFLDQPKPVYIPLNENIRTFDDNHPPKHKLLEPRNSIINNENKSTMTVNFDIGSKMVSVDRVTNTYVINKYFCTNLYEFETEELVAIQFSDNTIVYITQIDYEENKDEINTMSSKAVVQKYGICAE